MDHNTLEELMNAALDREADAPSQAALAEQLIGNSSALALSGQLRQQDLQLRRAFAAHRERAITIAQLVEQALQNSPQNPPSDAKPRHPWLALLSGLAAGFLLAALLFLPWQKVDRPSVDSQLTQTGGPLDSADAQTAKSHLPGVQNAMAHLTLATGPVEVRPRGQLQQFRCPTQGAIVGGMEVCTGEKVCCELSTPDGSAIRMNADTTLRFDQSRDISIERGQLWSSVARSSSPMSIKAKNTVVRAEEAVFEFSCSGQQTRLRVLQGTARLTGKDGSKTVRAGTEVTMQNGTLAEESAMGEAVLSTAWMNEVLKLKRPEDAELQERIQHLLANIGRSKLEDLYESEIRALGEGSVPPMIYFLRRSPAGSDRQMRIEAARILADLAATRAISELIALLDDDDGQVRFHIARALQRLTENTFDRSPEQWRDGSAEDLANARKDWQHWWTENKTRYRGLGDAPQSET